MAYTVNVSRPATAVQLHGTRTMMAEVNITGTPVEGGAATAPLQQIEANIVNGGYNQKPFKVDIVNITRGPQYIYSYDVGTTTYALTSASSDLTGFTNNLQPYADNGSEADGDGWYLGATEMFERFYLDLSTVATYDGNLGSWEYTDDADDATSFSTLTVRDNTDAGTETAPVRHMVNDGSVNWTVPSDWAKVTINSISAYWLRYDVSNAGQNGTAPLIFSVSNNDVHGEWYENNDVKSTTASSNTSHLLFSGRNLYSELGNTRFRIFFHFENFKMGGLTA